MRLLLMSGGIDSAAIAWWRRPDVCLTIDYGQVPAAGELSAAKALCAAMGLRHETLAADLGHLGSGVLSGREALPSAAAGEWWPYRNQMLATLAAMRFVGEGLREIMIGAVATDIHADGKGPFLSAMDAVLALQEGGVRLTAPALGYSTPELVRASGFPPGLLGACFSCHALEVACGQCGGCIKHLRTLAEVRPASAEAVVPHPAGRC